MGLVDKNEKRATEEEKLRLEKAIDDYIAYLQEVKADSEDYNHYVSVQVAEIVKDAHAELEYFLQTAI